jgi:ketosteroid isomerase-like protein
VPEAQRQEVLTFVRAYADAANRGDVTAYMDMYSQRAQLIAVNDGDITRGWDKLRDEANSMLGLEGSYRISVGSTDVIGLGATRAIAVFPFVASIATQQGTGQLRGAMTLVLEKGSQGWKIIHDHTSTAPANPQ